MKRILCTGDSHTWGQGATDSMTFFDPPVQGGELRLQCFKVPSYVNLLRRKIEQTTSSCSTEWEAQTLAKQLGVKYEAPCAHLPLGQSFTLPFTGALIRFEYAGGSEPTVFEMSIDEEPPVLVEEPVSRNSNDYRLQTLPLKDDAPHQLTLRVLSGTLLLYRVEIYSGPFAVVNSGIGSCPTFRYLEDYFDDYVKAVKPDIVLAEAHTINDWLTVAPTSVYAERLRALLKAYQDVGAAVILMTVSPVYGEQECGDAPYEEYVETSRKVAAELGIPVCDTNRIMHEELTGMTEEQTLTHLFEDKWHPNDHGHAIYADALFEMVKQLLTTI